MIKSCYTTGIVALFILFTSGFAGAQNTKRTEKLFETARSLYSSDQYAKAIEVCGQILDIDSEDVNTHLLLSEMYKDMDSTRLEIIHLTKAQKNSDNALIDFRLGEAFYRLGMYSEALSFYEKYKAVKNISEKRQFLLACKMASCKFAIQAIANPVNFEPNRLGDGVNSEFDEYWPTPTLDGKHLVFTRLVRDSVNRPQEDFFMVELDSVNWEAQPMDGVNTNDNEGAQTLSADSRIIFFTACNRPDGLGSCDIYFSRFLNGKWTEPRSAGSPLNTSAWEAQPTLSSDNHFLYFSSNRPGGKGKKDIWRVEFLGFGEDGDPMWGKPENLALVNTDGDEVSPFIHANNQNFYFASDGHVGMGGLDLFSAFIDENGEVHDVKNMGYPINTFKDDMGLTISSIGDVAYFSSARESDRGMDIFSFNLDRGLQPQPVTYVKATVRNKKTHQPIAATIELVNINSKQDQSRTQKADEKGEAMLALPLRRNYAFNVSESGYLFYSESMQLAEVNTITDPIILNIDLEPIEIGAQMELYNIYFETDSFRILPQSEPELQKLVSFLKTNPKLKVEIQGHTDSSGNPEKNLELSKLRAKSVVDYLVSNEIQLDRLRWDGYGDTTPIASNETPEGRRQNRRTTIKILEK
ncbi:OmpA family protein [Maribellus sp. YY47]|uniref:OmpA family protein n=1 Tax=Maribellus sp. YY47 TaxID=2929486 RepID=UPI002000B9B1|nr:OmpA family protein [Maribellus sp. YY47]MCK3684200.1 OmpA family protein [Maribellus sp. YY47]